MFITDKREFLSDVIVPDLQALLGDDSVSWCNCSYNDFHKFYDIRLGTTYNAFDVRWLPKVWDYFRANYSNWHLEFMGGSRFWLYPGRQYDSNHQSGNCPREVYNNFPTHTKWVNHDQMAKDLWKSAPFKSSTLTCSNFFVHSTGYGMSGNVPKKNEAATVAFYKDLLVEAGYEHGDYTFTCDRHSRTIYIDVVFKENT